MENASLFSAILLAGTISKPCLPSGQQQAVGGRVRSLVVQESAEF